MATTEVYLLRHAQTIPQEGKSNSEWTLSKEGYSQAKKLVEKLEDLDVDVVFTSPYLRAKETLEPFLKKASKEADEIEDFCDIRASGDYLDPVSFQELTQKMVEDIKFEPEDGESLEACQYRFMMAVNKIVKDNWGKKILICSHGLPIFASLKVFEKKLSYDDWASMPMPIVYKLETSVEVGGRWDRKFEIVI